jgi:hypothetical protein
LLERVAVRWFCQQHILVEASNVTIQSMLLKGDNPKLTGGVVVGGEDIDARNGIITNHLAGTYNNPTVEKSRWSVSTSEGCTPRRVAPSTSTTTP